MAFGFENPLAFFAFAAFIPLIILYLIRPRPIKQTIPSLMFFIHKSRLSKKDSFFRHFQRDILFLLQILAIALLAFAATQPFLSRETDASSSNLVFVLDVSASSHVLEGEQTRLELAKEKIKELAGSRANLVLAKSTPVIALQNEDNSELFSYLDRYEGTHEESSIGEAILLAGEMLQEQEGRVVVLSDFINTKGLNPETAKNVLLSKGIHVDFINTASEGKSNVGIIKLVPDEETITLYVKNYNPQDEQITIKVNEQEQQLSLKAESIETLLLQPQDDLTEISLEIEDDFAVDNKVYVSKPTYQDLNVLLVTNNKSRFLEAALNSLPGMNLEIAEPPVLPNEDYQVYLFHNINKDALLPGTFADIAEKVDEGASLIIHAQDDSQDIDYEDLLPVTLLNKTTPGGAVTNDQINKFTTDVDFTTTTTYFSAEKKEGLTLASINNQPLIVLDSYGEGLVVYYGLLEKESEFKLNPSYPLFWTGLVKFLTDTPDLEDINLQTGVNIQTTDGTFIPLEKTGIVKVGNQNIAVNLLNEEESSINTFTITGKNVENFQLEPVQDEVKTDFLYALILLGTLLIILEFAYTKLRGEF